MMDTVYVFMVCQCCFNAVVLFELIRHRTGLVNHKQSFLLLLEEVQKLARFVDYKEE